MHVVSCPHCFQTTKVSRKSNPYCPVCHMPLKTVSVNPQGSDVNAPVMARILARLLDYTIIAICGWGVNFFTHGLFFKSLHLTSGTPMTAAMRYAMLLELTLSLGYFIIFHTIHGKTPGKAVMGIFLRQYTEKPVRIIHQVLREIAVWLMLMTGGWMFLSILFSSRRRGLHDWLSGTRVCLIDSDSY
ncbi:MAG: RDD family protein [SAR324 cluster bacterium]|nr:RDD family protein [SAR324 cluster bacterium]